VSKILMVDLRAVRRMRFLSGFLPHQRLKQQAAKDITSVARRAM
jgi:hypothetical protein